MAQQWYVRIRGKTLGPFSLDRLVQSRDQGQLQPSHEVSTDRQTWVPAATLTEVFPPAPPGPWAPELISVPEDLPPARPAGLARPAGPARTAGPEPPLASRDLIGLVALAASGVVVLTFLTLSILVLVQQPAAGKDEGGAGAGTGREQPAGEKSANKPSPLAVRARKVLKTYCSKCHGPDSVGKGGFKDVLDRKRLVATGKVVLRDLARSELYQRVTSIDDPMPPLGVEPRPSPEDIDVLKRWIEEGAPDFASARRALPAIAELKKNLLRR
jgi:mono/diheme cytochrome c family protein